VRGGGRAPLVSEGGTAVDPHVEILELERFDLAGSPVEGQELQASEGPGFGIELHGSIHARDLVPTRVDLVQDAMSLWEVEPQPADDGRYAYYAPVNALALPPEFELVVRAQLGEGPKGKRARLAAVRGRRTELETGIESPIDPLMVTTFSRTGSNLLLRMLGEHPQVLAYKPFKYEPRVSAYWIEVLRELTEPASYRRQITPQLRQPQRGWWLGVESPAPPPLDEGAVEAAIALDTVNDLAAFCQSRIDAVYGRIAPAAERPQAAFFAEKHSPNEVPMILGELYPGAKEIFLVRDFRDMVASMLAANEARKTVRFGRGANDTDERFVRRFRRFAINLAASWRRRHERAQLVRYEDLIQRPRETVAAVAEYLGLDSDDTLSAAMTASLARREEALEGHITSGSPEASIGRWRDDLAPELHELADDVFGPALELFGYERAGRG
jgi:Sulfotransferase family